MLSSNLNPTFARFKGTLASQQLGREALRELEKNFAQFIAPFLDEGQTEDVSFTWEFQKFLHTKKLKVLTAEREGLRKWKEVLLSK